MITALRARARADAYDPRGQALERAFLHLIPALKRVITRARARARALTAFTFRTHTRSHYTAHKLAGELGKIGLFRKDPKCKSWLN